MSDFTGMDPCDFHFYFGVFVLDMVSLLPISQGLGILTSSSEAKQPLKYDGALMKNYPVCILWGSIVLSLSAFCFANPVLSGISPTAISPGMQVTLTGSGFGATQGSSGLVQIGPGATGTVVSWSDTQVVVTVPSAGLQPGNMSIRQNGVWSNAVAFTVIPPVLTSISPTAISPGMQVTLTGSGFGATQGSSGLVQIGPGATGTVVSWSDTQVVVTVPSAGLQPGNMFVRQNGVWSNAVAFTVIPPILSSISPTAISPGMQVTLTGSGFGATQGSSGLVQIGPGATGTVVSWSDTQVVVTVPSAGLQPGNMFVRQNGVWSNSIAFTVVSAPSLASLSPGSGSVGTVVTVSGSNLGTGQSASVTFNGIAATPTNWTNTSITVPVPSAATTGNVLVTIGGLASNGKSFTVTPAISSLSPSSGPIGTSVTITGTTFGASQGTSAVTFNGTAATPTSWSTGSIAVPVPSGATSGNVVVIVGGAASNGASFTVQNSAPIISSLSPTSGLAGAYVGIGGTNFGTSQGSGSVTFNGTVGTVISWGNASIIAQVPTGASSGPVQVNVGGQMSNSSSFTVLTQPPPTIQGLSEVVGAPGDAVTISGVGFGTTGAVSFNGTSASATSWTDSVIVTQVPSGAQTGPVTVTSSGQTSNAVTMTVIAAPTITSVSPNSGDAGTVVTITGSSFNSLQNGPVVYFNGAAATPTSWTSTQIVVTVPKGTTTGPLKVKVGPSYSNGSNFTIVFSGSQTLSIMPGNASLFVGQSLNLSLVDDLEHPITGATWTLDSGTLAQLSTADPPVLTAEATGTVNVTATWNNLSATAQITISATGVTLPLGTVVCSLPTRTSQYAVQQILQLVPTGGSTPDLVAVEDDGQGSIWLRGISSGCEQWWHTRVGSSSISSPDFVVGETPDNLGGVIVLVSNTGNSGFPGTNSLIRVDGPSGNPTWRYDSQGQLGSQNPPAAVAVDQSGNILTAENYQLSGGTYTQSHLIKLDPNSGTQVGSWPWPSSSFAQLPDGCGFGIPSSNTYASSSGAISVGPDGSYYVPIGWENETQWDVMTPGEISCAEYSVEGTVTTTTRLMTVSPSGSVSFADFPGSPAVTALGGNLQTPPPSIITVIPDGSGGALATAVFTDASQPATQINDFGGSGSAATISNFGYQGARFDMVLGDQGTYFITDGNQIVNVNGLSGSELWRWQPNSGTVQIVAAATGGGVVLRNIIGSDEDVVRLDQTGTPSFDSWGTTATDGGYGILSNSTYWNSNTWVGISFDGLSSLPVISGLVGNPLGVAPATYAFSGGTEQHQGSSDPGLLLTGLQDCHKANQQKTLYARYPQYNLVSSTTFTAPAQNYTVFEFIPGQKSRSSGPVCNKYANLDPCNYGNATVPYNEFDDEISTGLYGGTTHQRQYFLYGLPNQRLYGVKLIYRTIPGGSLQLKQPNISWNDLYDVPQTDPLIDGQPDPWLAPWDLDPSKCDSTGSIYFP